MIAIIKTLARFLYGKKHALSMGISSIVLAVSLAQLHPGLTQAQGTPQITAAGGRDAISVLQARGTASKQPYGPKRPAPVQAAATPAAPVSTPVAAAAAPVATPELIGSVGYARAGGNCVNEPGVNNPRTGNPISWAVTSQTPTVGATALFTWNHVGVVTGIWSNGDLEIRHQNYWGGQHRFPRGMIRGFR